MKVIKYVVLLLAVYGLLLFTTAEGAQIPGYEVPTQVARSTTKGFVTSYIKNLTIKYLSNRWGVETEIATEIDTTTVEVTSFDTEISRLSTKYKLDETLARKIIECESKIYGNAENKNYRPEWNEDLGTTTMTHWSSDWGFWQINDYWHEKSAEKIGLDIYDWKDNLKYGAILLSRDGTRHWNASKWCWKDYA